ncbi:hypothetical protein MKW98_015546 [Papaver atlanticum]|uniref:Late embryogenesis abundant protein LEA-2 subgroup domain-containing protein n=1 Tax=Papaver atlanticum TaxID=357466 RepID=A0AAD4S4G9_9MAGN|nr:hypothetical protein MKW98_015546 [Papaver atlanticum]
MAPNTTIPIQSTPENRQENRPLKRHHTARYYAHRVRESLATRVSKIICSVFLALLLFLGIITFILWLSLRPHRPRFHMRNFSVSGLNQENGLENARIAFDVTARNSNQNIGIFYDAMDGTVFYQEKPVGTTPLLFPFYQSSKNTTWIHGEVGGTSLDGDNEKGNKFINELGGGKVAFRLELTSTIRFKVSTWDSKRHRMHATCLVEVGQDGAVSAVLWLILHPRKPNYTVMGIEVVASGRNITNDTHRNITNINLKIQVSNPNNSVGIYHDVTQITLYYGDENIGMSSFQGFYLGHKKITQREIRFDGLERFQSAVSNTSLNQTVNLKVSLLSGFRYKVFWSKTGNYKIDLQGYVTASLGGRKLDDGMNIKLKSGVF